MDKKFLKDKGLLKEAKRFNYLMEYVAGIGVTNEVDANADGLDDATGMADPMAAGGAAPVMDPMAAGGAAPASGMDPMAAGGMAPGAAPAQPVQQGVPGFDPQQQSGNDEDPNATAEQSFDEAIPDDQQQKGQGEDKTDELEERQEKTEDAIEKLTGKFEEFLGKFDEFQEELKSNAEFMENLKDEFEKRNPTSVEKLTMRSTKSKPFGETPEEYMENNAPENYSSEDDNNGVGEPRYTITRDDIRNATDYPSIAKTLRDNENATLKTLLGL